MLSIRARTLLLVLGLLSLSMTLISYKSYRDAQHEIEELFDAQLVQTARLLAGMVGRDMPTTDLQALQDALDQVLLARPSQDDEILLDGHPYEGKLAFQVLDEKGAVLLRSASAPADLFQQMAADSAQTQSGEAIPAQPLSAIAGQLLGYRSLSLADYQWRVFLLRDPQDNHWILVGEREDVRGELVGNIARRSLLPDLIGLPLLALLVWLAVGWGLRPLQRMADLIKARAPDNLTPLVLSPMPAELEPMGAALNRLLMQVNQLLDQEKRFIADAAHELRTPLAVLRIHAQNALAASDPSDRDEALRQLGGGVERTTRVVAQLLTLARLDPNGVQLTMVEFDLLGFFRNELAELTPLALERQQELSFEADEAGDYRLHGDAPSLGTLLQNLIGNAVQYTPVGGRIQVQLQACHDELLLRVQDSGPGVDATLREKLFERFYRLEEGQGAGLGLSIVLRIVQLHRGTITLDESPLGGLDVCVSLPRHGVTPA